VNAIHALSQLSYGPLKGTKGRQSVVGNSDVAIR
jgi:hypothetical protein